MSCTCAEIRADEARSFVARWSRGHCDTCIAKIQKRSPPACPMCYNFANKRGDVCRSCLRRARRYANDYLLEYEVELEDWYAWAEENWIRDPHYFWWNNPRPEPMYAVPKTRADAHVILIEFEG